MSRKIGIDIGGPMFDVSTGDIDSKESPANGRITGEETLPLLRETCRRRRVKTSLIILL